MAVIIAAALLLFSISAAIAQNIDTTEPIVRSAPPGLQNSSYFGYSLVLHRIASVTSGSTFLQHVNAARYYQVDYSAVLDNCSHFAGLLLVHQTVLLMELMQ